ncbi:hypothetical protein Pmani_038702 [Petrolisthes manimaculis]|uniref:Uncharacterized protein n=1 Tax=Petrolisthes manimaculis TaxID=1843537 RepID=A0AAE1TK94_9EUCA|nr:hypothetical protein Pmani_038702 [Petrolisthes manimaculis]
MSCQVFGWSDDEGDEGGDGGDEGRGAKRIWQAGRAAAIFTHLLLTWNLLGQSARSSLLPRRSTNWHPSVSVQTPNAAVDWLPRFHLSRFPSQT